MNNALKLSALTLCAAVFVGCGSTPAQPLVLGESVELKNATVAVKSIEKASSIKNNDMGSVITAEDGKVIYIVTHEVTNTSDELSYGQNYGSGLYLAGSKKGDAKVSTEIPGVLMDKDILSEGMQSYIEDIEAGATVMLQEFYYVDADAELEYKLGEQFSWDNLHKVAVADVVTERAGESYPEFLTQFMDAFDGTSDTVKATLEAFGMPFEAQPSEIIGFALEEADVVSFRDNCAYMTFKSSVTQRAYNICFSETGDVVSVDFEGITPGVIR